MGRWLPLPPNGLSTRLVLAFVGVIALPMLVLALVVPQIARVQQMAALENRLAAEAIFLADEVAALTPDPLPGDNAVGSGPAVGGADSFDALAKRLGARADVRVTLISLDGTVVGESHQDLAQVGNHADRREVRQALATGRGVDLHHSETVGYDMLYVAVPIVRDERVLGVARAALPLSEV